MGYLEVVVAHDILQSVTLMLLLSSVTVVQVSCGRHVWLTEDDTLYLRWQTRLGPLAQCAVAWPNGTETILPEPSPPLPSPENDAAANSFDPAYAGDGYLSGQCGLRVDNVTAGVRDWTLKAVAADGQRHDQYTSRVTCIAKQWPRSSTVRVPIGTALNVTCGPPMAVYCRMSSPSGEITRRPGQCWVYIKSVGSHHLDSWACWSVTTKSATEVQYTVQLQAYRDGARTELGSNQTSLEVRVFCNVRDGPVPTLKVNSNNNTTNTAAVGLQTTYCKLTLPRDTQTLSLAYGRGTTRYAFYGSADSDCGVSFPKPVRRDEIGRWKCANAVSDGRVYGGFVIVTPSNNTRAAGIPKLTVTSGNSVIVPRGNSFQVECTVPANIDYCWLRHPNGTTVPVTVSVDGSEGHHHTSRYQYAGEGLSFGQCLVAVADASTSDTGPWLCALGLRDDRREMYGTVNVTVSETVIAARQDELYATEGSRIALGCYTIEQQPIAYCRFLAPQLIGFTVDERPSSSTPPPSPRYAYAGQGLTAGHCGLSVDRIDESDYGNWTCAVKIVDSAGSGEVSITIVLRKPEGFTMVQIIGIVFCGTLISVMSLFFANHLITSPSAKTRKKIEKLELLEAAEIGVGSRRIGGRRAAAYSGTPHVVRTQPGRSRHGSVAPRRI